MYIPKYFELKDEGKIIEFMKQNAFGILLSVDRDEVMNSQIPFLISREGDDLFVEGHLAKENEHSRKIDGNKVSALFLGPHHYISPRWYTIEKSVPTWDYSIVKATGIARILNNEETLKQLRGLSMNFDPQWDAMRKDREEYYQNMVKEIVSFKFKVDVLEGKMKMSQNRPKEDIKGIISNLEQTGSTQAIETSKMVREFNKNRL